MRTQQASERTTNRCHTAQIDGRSWQVFGNAAKCSVPPGQRPPHGAHVVTPDERKRNGWRIAWLFLGGLVAAFIASPWIAKALGWCAMLALPLWVAR